MLDRGLGGGYLNVFEQLWSNIPCKVGAQASCFLYIWTTAILGNFTDVINISEPKMKFHFVNTLHVGQHHHAREIFVYTL